MIHCNSGCSHSDSEYVSEVTKICEEKWKKKMRRNFSLQFCVCICTCFFCETGFFLTKIMEHIGTVSPLSSFSNYLLLSHSFSAQTFAVSSSFPLKTNSLCISTSLAVYVSDSVPTLDRTWRLVTRSMFSMHYRVPLEMTYIPYVQKDWSASWANHCKILCQNIVCQMI